MIGQFLNLTGDSLTRVMIPRATPELSDKDYSEISARVINYCFPFMTQFLDNGKITRQLNDCLTIPDLEKLKVDLIYPSLFSDIAEKLNEEYSVNDSERTFLLAWISDRMIKGAQDWYQASGHQRAQAIATQAEGGKKKVGKIIGIDGKPAKPGKILT